MPQLEGAHAGLPATASGRGMGIGPRAPWQGLDGALPTLKIGPVGPPWELRVAKATLFMLGQVVPLTMATRVDSLRSTLDQLALDPNAEEDRPYLISMLRRLGYSDAEIAAAIGKTPEKTSKPAKAAKPAPALEAEPEHEAAPERPPRPKREGPRVIEVEYTGPAPGEEEGFDVSKEGEEGEEGEEGVFADDDTPGYDGEGEDFGDFDMSAVDAVEDSWDDDWGEGEFGSAMEARERGEDAGMSDAERRKLLEELGLDPDDESLVEFGPRPRPKYNKPAKASEELVEFTPIDAHAATSEPTFAEETFHEAPSENWDDGGWEPEADAGSWGDDVEDTWEEEVPEVEATPEVVPVEPEAPEPVPEVEAEVDQAWETEAWESAEESPQWSEGWPEEDTVDAEIAPESEQVFEEHGGEPAPGAFTYEDYTLYTREVELSTGKHQRIYFFAKNAPKNGEPCALPDGYEVRENEQTGLPFLRRVHADEAEDVPATPKRVRAVRVKASSREEAERLLREQGYNVRGAEELRIDERDDQ